MATKVLQSFQGSGVVQQNGIEVAKVKYSLTQRQELLDATGMGGQREYVPGLKSGSGTMRAMTGRLPLGSDDLVLKLENGQRVKFLISRHSMPSDVYDVLLNGDFEETEA